MMEEIVEGEDSVDATMEKMRVLDKKFRRACKQIMLLNQCIEDKQTRYNRAHRNNQRSWRYTLRLQLATLEGMRNMFYEYAHKRADELEALQDAMVEAGMLSETEEDLEWSDSD